MTPILYSFRRCPYAMRARLALRSAGENVELREILLRDKPAQMLEASPKGTVPVLITEDGVVDESLDIMKWALKRHDPEGLLNMPDAGNDWISQIDGPFKTALDRYKYPTRYEGVNPIEQRDAAASILARIDGKLATKHWIYGENPSLADLATLTFVRQYANVDRAWFDAQPWPNVIRWLEQFLSSERFFLIMEKHVPWKAGDAPIYFGT